MENKILTITKGHNSVKTDVLQYQCRSGYHSKLGPCDLKEGVLTTWPPDAMHIQDGPDDPVLLN